MDRSELLSRRPLPQGDVTISTAYINSPEKEIRGNRRERKKKRRRREGGGENKGQECEEKTKELHVEMEVGLNSGGR